MILLICIYNNFYIIYNAYLIYHFYYIHLVGVYFGLMGKILKLHATKLYCFYKTAFHLPVLVLVGQSSWRGNGNRITNFMELLFIVLDILVLMEGVLSTMLTLSN
ncbi:hypothetical protein ACJX0J_014273 [Zea mays]